MARKGLIVRGGVPQHIAKAMLREARDPALCGASARRLRKEGAVKNARQDCGYRLPADYDQRLKR